MSSLRIQQNLVLTALTLGVGVVVFHALYKPPPEGKLVAGIASYMSESSRWQGKFAPDFDLRLRSGESFRLAEHIGHEVIILNFFATWCRPCREEMPELNAYVAKQQETPVVLVGINVDEKSDKVDAFCRELKIAFPVGIDTNGVIAKLYGVSSYPTTVFIGADGRVGLFQIGVIANADVVFASLVTPQIELIKQNLGIGRSEYETGLANQVSPVTPSRSGASQTNEPDIKLDEPARVFAERMKCPSCKESVSKCCCNLCGSVKKKLATMSVTNRTDEQILWELFMEEGKTP